jgi:ABC-type multidrug transport system fused ATPase/permease subunit
MLASGMFASGLMKRKKAYSDATADYVAVVNEYIQGKKEIVAYDKQSIFLQKHKIKNEGVENTRVASNLFEVKASLTSVSMGFIAQVAVIGISAYFVAVGSMTFGFLIAMYQLMNQLISPIFQAVEALNGMRSAKAIIEKANETHKDEAPKTASLTDFSDSLLINNLGISYNDNEPVIKDLNISFTKGGKYAICAPSGFGKSSIARALALELCEFDGTITIDGQNICEIKPADYHKILRYVRQTPHLFNDTVINNLLFFDSFPDKNEFDRILNITKVSEFMPNDEALEREISNNSGLSGGQKQRIVLARALLHKPQILVLDEITSGVDLNTAYTILVDLFENKNLTCIVITHETDKQFLSLFDEVINLKEMV